MELSVGDPSKLATDVGPVIDQKALQPLVDHVEYLKDKATLHYQCEIPDLGDTQHFFFAPRLYELDDISILKEEVFGPCVHVIRFKGTEIDKVIEDINGTGFGLTMGIHSRIEGRAERLAKASAAGNIYINRNMIGAVVGVQPLVDAVYLVQVQKPEAPVISIDCLGKRHHLRISSQRIRFLMRWI